MNHHHHLCYLMFMILLEYNHHSLSRLLHWDNHPFNVTTIIDVIKYILQYIVWLKLIKNIKKMMTTIMIFGLILLYITTLSLTSSSTTMKRNIFYPYIVPCIDSSINSLNLFNKHSLIDSLIGVSSQFNHNPIQSFLIMLLNLCFVCNGIPDITVFSWIFLRSILHISGITFYCLILRQGVCCYLVYLWYNNGMNIYLWYNDGNESMNTVLSELEYLQVVLISYLF